MNEEISPMPVPRNQLREEAANWFAIMRGPDADAHRDDFNRWLARGALHRSAYNSIAETFNLGKALKGEAISNRTGRHPAELVRTLLACGVGAILLSTGWYGLSRHYPGLPFPGETQTNALAFEARYATGIGEIRSFILKDGSKLTLDTSSVVLASYTQGERSLRLMAGRARFSPAPESRPFAVRADTALIRANGSIFDVALSGNRQISIVSLQGPLDVQTQIERGSGDVALPTVTTLVAGRQFSTGPDHQTLLQPAPVGKAQWIEGVQAFNDVSLTDLVAETNRYARSPILLDDPAMGTLHISGTYRLRDTEQVADKLAALLDLRVAGESDAYRLRRR